MDQTQTLTRICPDHHIEVEFRPAGRVEEAPCCPRGHVCDYWLVVSPGREWAVATLRPVHGYLPMFDVDATVAQMRELQARRQVAEPPHSDMAEACA